MKTEKKIHLLLVIRWPVGGIRTFLRYVYSQFEKKKYKLTLVLPRTSELEATVDNLKCVDVEYVVLSKEPGFLEFITSISKIIRREPVDLIHSHGFSSGVYAALPAKFCKIPHLFTSHDVFTDKQFLGLKGQLKKIIISLSFHLADRIHSVSRDAQANLLSYFPEQKRVSSKLVVIQNGVEVERFLGTGKINWRKELHLPNDTFLIGFFGRFMAQKGFKYLVDAIDQLKKGSTIKTPIVLAFGWGGFIREEQSEIEQKGIKDSFRFLPFQENIADAIRGVDVVAMPSLWEAYGLLAAEVMIAGIPLIGTGCLGLREVLAGTPGAVVPAGDSKKLAKALLQEMHHPTHVQANLFRGTAAQRFGVADQIKTIKALIGCIVNG